MAGFTTRRSSFLIQAFWLGICCYASPHLLAAQPYSADAAIPSQAALVKSSKTIKQFWKGRSYCTEFGGHFGGFSDVDWKKSTLVSADTGLGAPKAPRTADISNSEFWGQAGVLCSPYGVQYIHVFKERFFFRFKAMWTFFYPDKRFHSGAIPITLAGVPIIGKYVSLGKSEKYPWLSMALDPILYLGAGYVTSNNIAFSLDSVYFWGLSPALTIPLSERLFFENRFTFFLDKFFKKGWVGYHNCLVSVGLSYKL